MPGRISHIKYLLILFFFGSSTTHANNHSENLIDRSEKTETNILQIKSKSFSSVSYFNGFDSNIELKSRDTISGQLTFCAWIKPADLLKKNMAIVGIPNIFWFRTTTSRELQFTQPSVVDNNTNGLLLSNQNWVFVSLVIDFSDVKIYLNGQLSDQFEWQGQNQKWGNNIFIGKDNWQEYFHGSMHNIAIYKHAASQNQIIELYQKTASNIPLTDGVVFYHPLNNKNKFYSQGDLSESQNVTFPTDSIRGKVAHFTGNDCYLDFGKFPIDNTVTISAWVKPEVFNRDYGAIASFGHAFAFRLTTGGLLLFTIPQMADISDNTAQLILNQWQHIAVKFKEGLGATFYINGKKVKSFEEIDYQNAVKELKIGTNLWNDFFKGEMDDVIIWNRTLTDAEIRKVYTTNEDYWKPILKKDQSSRKIMFITILLLLIIGFTFYIFLKKRLSSKGHHEQALKINPFMEKVNTIVEKNLADSEFSVERFAQEVYVSKTKLYNELKSITGKSPKEYIRKQRLLKAAQLLKETDKPIAEISFETGFESRAYFNKCFKQRFKTTPTSYRKTLP